MIKPIDTTFKAPESSKELILDEYEVLRLIAEKLNEVIEHLNKQELSHRIDPSNGLNTAYFRMAGTAGCSHEYKITTVGIICNKCGGRQL